MDKIYEDNIRNFHYAAYPYFYHPSLEMIQMAIVIITVILSVDRYVAVFYPFRIYRQSTKESVCVVIDFHCLLSVPGCFRTLLRGPKRMHIGPYLTIVLGIKTSFRMCLVKLQRFIGSHNHGKGL